MCLLPDKSVFCYGNHPGAGKTFILFKDGNLKQLADGIPSGNMSSAHYNGFIYLFGGWDAAGTPWNQAAKFDLLSNKWYKISPLKEILSFVSCLAGDYGIIFVGYQSSKLHFYNHIQDNYNELYLSFAANTFKVLLQAENRIFLIDSSKNIHESEINKLSTWITIGASQISFVRAPISYQIYFNNNCFFLDENCEVYKFDTKSLQLTKAHP